MSDVITDAKVQISGKPPNGKTKKESMPAIMDIQNMQNTQQIAGEIKNQINASKQGIDLTKYQVMVGMQDPDKRQFFTEYENRDDVLRMNTIERYVDIAPLIIRKCSPDVKAKIDTLMKKVYHEHVEEHKENMSALKRGRESAYVKILSSESSDSGAVPTGFRKFFGIGSKK